jgi:hypothetical protein
LTPAWTSTSPLGPSTSTTDCMSSSDTMTPSVQAASVKE